MKEIISSVRSGLVKLARKAVNKARNFFWYPQKIIKAYADHDGELSTCALAFFFLISFIPASLVVISLMSYVFDSQDMVAFYMNHVKLQLPAVNIDDITRLLDRILYSKRYLAFIWVPFLFWWASFIFDIFERVLEKAFRITQGRKYWRAKLRHFGIILGIASLVVSFGVLSNILVLAKKTSVICFIERNLNDITSINSFIKYLHEIPFLLTSFSNFVINSLLFFTIYRFVPPKKIDRKSLLKGALWASFIYELVKTLFSYYITEINDYSSIFGPLSTIVILMIWLWYTCFIFVMGAELSYVFYEKKEESSELDFE